MKTNTLVTFSLVTTTILVAGMATALADDNDASTTRRMTAPRNTLEIALGGTYSQGTGDLAGGMQSLEDYAGPGGGVEMSVGWRATPNLLIGGYATLSGFSNDADKDNGAVTGAIGYKADWHFLPAASVDPWISAGAGLKFMGIEDGANDRALTGVEGRIQIGADYRVSPSFAFGPVIGAGATVYTHEYDDSMPSASDDAVEIDDKKVNWTFSAGLQGRFNAFGKH